MKEYEEIILERHVESVTKYFVCDRHRQPITTDLYLDNFQVETQDQHFIILRKKQEML